jgi:hypothetical protein
MRRSWILLPIALLLTAPSLRADDGGQAARRDAEPNPHREFTERHAAGLSCEICHSCEEPTRDDPCLNACGFCHTTEPQPRFNHAITVEWELGPYHTDVDCQECLGDPKHFRTPTGACDDCHVHGEAGSFDHRVTGLALSEIHMDLDCEDRHTDRAFEKDPTCLDCHEDELYPDFLPGEGVSPH